MPIFRYSGYRTDGTDVTGTIEASGLNDAIVRIKVEGVLPSDISEVGVRVRKGVFRRLDEAFLPNMTRQLSLLLSSGVPLVEALQALSNESRGFYRGMLIAIKERVSGGASLYKALEDFNPVFPEFYVNMVQAGEASGNLDRVLIRLADFLESQNTVRSRVRSSMIYPVLMMGVSIVVLSFLFTFVIPKIVKVFKDSHSSLPFITVMLIFISNLFINYWWAIIGCVIAAAASVRRFIRRHRRFVDRVILRLPGNIIQSLYYARFSRTLGFLLDGGLPMLRALRLSARSMGNRELEGLVLSAEGEVAEGQRLSSSLKGFPPVFIQLVATGEKSGRLSETLNRAADSYEEEFNRRVNRAVSIFEPAMILFMGIVVGFIVLAVLLPMFQLNQLVR
ncbi:MAG: type II secretion system inner membrane protein GspF [Thermodesulfovibrionales bacterium]